MVIVFLDTNILVYATVVEAPLHTVARKAIQDLGAEDVELWLSRQVLREYLAVLSRPQTFSQPIPVTALIKSVQDFEHRFYVAEDSSLVTAKLLELLANFSSGGKQVHDANIVATMLVHGVSKLLTNNPADFARFSSLIGVLTLQK